MQDITTATEARRLEMYEILHHKVTISYYLMTTGISNTA
jgi:hypothetical protein